MVGRIQHRRLSSAAAGWAATLKYGEISVNPVRRRLAVGDTDGTVRELLPVTFYDARSQYAVGDVVIQASLLYKCNTTIGTPEAFNASKWDQISYTQGALETYFDTQYSQLGHNHDGTYSLLGHNHDGTYSLLGHNHDASYAALSHNHDSAYAALSHNHDSAYVNVNGDSMSGTLTIGVATALIANGKISVNAGATPTGDIHVKNTSEAQILVESTAGSTTKARLDLKNSGRAYSIYGDATNVVIRDETGATDKVTIKATGGVQVGAPTGGDKGASALNVAGGIWDNGVRLNALDVQEFTASGTWTDPGFGTYAIIELIGGGGSGGNNNDNNASSGGGGGGYRRWIVPLALLGATETVTIGAGGAAVVATQAVGNNGGNTTFGSWLTAYGGGGGYRSAGQGGGGGGWFGAGLVGPSSATENGGKPWEGATGAAETRRMFGGGTGNVPATMTVSNSEYGGGGGGLGSSGSPTNGGDSDYGGGGGGGGGSTAHGTGGVSKFGGNGGDGGQGAANGTDGTQPGGGGGGCRGAGQSSGKGGDGFARITVI